MESRKIVVGMSGGVDSSMALLLLKKQGWQPVGVSLKLPVWEGAANCMRENACCTAESLRIARDVCRKLGVPHHIYDVRREFGCKVMDYFVSELRQGRTPNPCAVCNRHLKFKKLFEWARKHGIKYVATGHYAKTCVNARTHQAELLMPKDLQKDQTYGLSLLPRAWLKQIIFPLGKYTKKEVYRMAEREGFEIFLKRKQSQDLCFVSSNEMPQYLKETIGEKQGAIVDDTGRRIGGHCGLHFYTIGQRRGLNLPDTHFVKAFDVQGNQLVVTRNRKELLQKEVLLRPFNFMAGGRPKGRTEVSAKIRYRQEPQRAVLFPAGRGVRVVFKKPLEAIALGQICAVYKNKKCLGGGFIAEAK
ncbi:MAG: tRNA 2-thiouridine(34) synthase MnmA [Candidatus Burarchaeum sp.]|nr:tRNA 2-thiouridine(34) synthase MnmA [Candidatus Burarchaeum sp.]MDO8339286.1 tRNA 2-thiouridine(34) synthase MnmA [Candidatus Burarchaeum sp.]